MRAAKTLMSTCISTGSSEPSLLARATMLKGSIYTEIYNASSDCCEKPELSESSLLVQAPFKLKYTALLYGCEKRRLWWRCALAQAHPICIALGMRVAKTLISLCISICSSEPFNACQCDQPRFPCAGSIYLGSTTFELKLHRCIHDFIQQLQLPDLQLSSRFEWELA